MKDFLINSKITSLQLDVLKAIHQRTLTAYTDGPTVERARLFFLLLPFFEEKNWSSDIENSAKTVSVVYTALSAHDQVNESSPVSKKQQLTVLAGDFYSGIYYQMLSSTNNIKLIQQLATGITHVSEKKTSFFENPPLPVAEIELSIDVIETELLSIFYAFYDFDEYIPLANLMLNYTAYFQQLESLREGEQTRILDMLNRSLSYPLYTERWLLDKLEALYGQIIKSLESYSISPDLKRFMLDQITPHQQIAEQLTREG